MALWHYNHLPQLTLEKQRHFFLVLVLWVFILYLFQQNDLSPSVPSENANQKQNQCLIVFFFNLHSQVTLSFSFCVCHVLENRGQQVWSKCGWFSLPKDWFHLIRTFQFSNQAVLLLHQSSPHLCIPQIFTPRNTFMYWLRGREGVYLSQARKLKLREMRPTTKKVAKLQVKRVNKRMNDHVSQISF